MKARDGTVVFANTRPYYIFDLEEQSDIELTAYDKTELEKRLIKAGFKNHGNVWKYNKPVIFYGEEPMVYMVFVCILDEKEGNSFGVRVVSSNGDMEPWYYNREFGINDMVPKIENKVNDQLNRFIQKGLIKAPRRYNEKI